MTLQKCVALPKGARPGLVILIAAILLTLIAGHALAQTSSLGIGMNETAMQPTGPFANFIYWINAQQRSFYLAMTQSLKAMRENPWHASVLVGLSFLYGILHAVGPGHGKAVISSYMLANETTLRRGIFLSFASSMLQAISAIAIIGVTFLVLRGTTISMDDATRLMEIASFGLIAAFGLALLWRKVPLLWATRTVPVAAHEHGHADHHHAGHHHDHAHHHHHHHHGPGEVCASCGHSHAPDPAMIAGEFNWKTAWAAIIAVGLRPCSGALIVLTFSLLNGLVIGGILSVFAMAIGTFITVAILATLSVMAKNVALRLSGSSSLSSRMQSIIEIAGALFITVFGLVLLAAALQY
ncbi:nickel/cobalt transporter [Phyllobacterium sp. 0TCS1.6C]|uniref:nickel/cobalt transporter n=1 Tax=unclassified Phyllobacterium TaxID=2638441 RepID=UPI00226554AE|nr:MULTISPECIES: nickel/cobalt transporter [unclassified Phyllobacterium]MCX8280902.1 nickel/cobalt transporter [Phyllobacterium sp. 0TCS1.6C]MCX8295768.1 nickel/cobalt transporter [Phyllobacterium sp. 0TCS1.6A]